MASANATPDSTGGIPSWRFLPPCPPPPSGTVEAAPVVIVGSGPIGIALAIDLAQRGHRVVLLGRFAFVPFGSKAICFSKRSLDILDRLGVGRQAVEKGVTWNVGKVFWRDSRDPIYEFDMLPVKDQKMPGFINIPQYVLEDLLLERAAGLPNIDFRPGHEVIAIDAQKTSADIVVRASDVNYRISADWLIACDGSRSFVREAMGLDFEGRIFEDNFLIADIRMDREQSAERWFWFDPPFNPGQSALMHKQPDGVWRLDFQLGWGIDRDAAVQPENVERYVRAMLGEKVVFEKEWYSVYTFQCRRMEQFVHDRVIFAGDSAHLVSPFGARGCNGGLADIDNLGWKLDLIMRGTAGPGLLASYNDEAVITADVNIQASTRSADFLTPKTAGSMAFRDAVLELASEFPFARHLVNSGRLSTAVAYPTSALNTPDEDDWEGRGVAPGNVALDGPLDAGWLLDRLGRGFALLTGTDTGQPVAGVETIVVPPRDTLLRTHFDLDDRAACLLRPDQYVAARWKRPAPEKIVSALARATGGAL